MQKNIYDPNFIKSLFNRMSHSYERVNYITSFGFSARWRRQFIDHLSFSKRNYDIIDLMTGMGEAWNAINKKFPNSNLTALDISEGMLSKSKIKNQKLYKGKVNILTQNVLKNTIKNETFDIVVSAFGLKTFDSNQIRLLAKEVNRILKPTGQFSFIEVSKPNSFVLNFLYRVHLKYIVPLFGLLFLGNIAEYKFLCQYTNRYKNSDIVFECFKKEGFSVTKRSYFFGCATGVTGIKRDE